MKKQDSRKFAPGRRKALIQIAKAGAALSVSGSATRAFAQAARPFRIGMLNTFSKAASLGTGNLNGMNLYFEEIGWQVAGRKIEIIREDDELSPQTGLAKLRKLVESDKVDMVVGPQLSSVALSILGYVRDTKTFLLCNGAGLTEMAWQKNPLLFRSSTSSWQCCSPMAEYLAENVSKELVIVASDFAGGRDVVKEFKGTYLAKGGKIIKEIYPPLNTADYSVYLADVRSIAPKLTFNFLIGGDAVRYVKQYDELGLKGKTTLAGFAVIDLDTMPAQGKSAIGGLSTAPWAETLDNPENRKFVADYRKKHNAWPDFYGEYGYTSARVIAETIKAVNGDTADKEKFARAMVNVKFNAARGPFAFDPATNNVIQNTYIREAVEIDGRIGNKVIATYRDVRVPATRT